MIFLVTFNPFLPSPGLAFWSLLIFLVFWFMMSKFALKPIIGALKSREHDIQTALDEAKKAKLEMANLRAENERVMNEARAERANILKEAKEKQQQMINDAKTKAQLEANKIISDAKLEIENQKKSAILEVKNQVGTMALDVAEKIIKKNLHSDAEQVAFANKLVEEINLN